MSVTLFARKPHQNILQVTHGLAAIVAAGYCRGDRVVSSVAAVICRLVGLGSASPAGRLVGLGSGREVRVGSGWEGGGNTAAGNTAEAGAVGRARPQRSSVQVQPWPRSGGGPGEGRPPLCA